jgi:DNA modification methylase
MNRIIQGDNLEVIKKIETGIVDLLYSNPPFGITNAEWDIKLDWDALWPEIWRVLKPNGVVVLHSSMPFTFDLVNSQRKYFKYNYVWIKNIATNFFGAKKSPLRKHEDVCVFYKQQPTYNPQMIGNEPHPKRLVKHGGTEKYWGDAKFEGKWGKLDWENGHIGRYPSTILNYPTAKSKANKKDAGTRVPEMIDFFIKTYSNEGDTVLDISAYTGITLERCYLLKRKFIGIEKDIDSVNIAEDRIRNITQQLSILK